ncbi:type I secretion system permease/ATPase [Methylobacterium durans]|uniref:type I secretion system permease/ATPase n=1 Tax=Methylobacterium durans TaxID=2202825 RepID=UPI002AFE1413|nr:type I secretion system permease/ATPase [Methylobacterium durans]MEA1834372.1 type I secretion system permease/ATPase [Methylobacterium durans]
MKPLSPDLSAALTGCRPALVSLAIVSGLVNVLYLTGSFFMLEVYDRVIPSRSVPSLIALLLLALILYAFQGALESLRGRMLTRISAVIDEALSPRVFQYVVRSSLSGAPSGESFLPLRDLDQVRGFLSSPGPTALCDLPFMPLYFAVCFLFHPLVGLALAAGSVLLILINVTTDRLTRGPSKAASEHARGRNLVVDAGCRNADVLVAMGMQGHFTTRWEEANQNYILSQQRVTDVAGLFSAASKVTRMALQSCVLALGAWLVINGEGSPGIIIASSILLGRALAPLDSMIASWKGVVATHQAWGRLTALLANVPQERRSAVLGAPGRELKADAVCVAPPGSNRLTVKDVSFTLKAGQAVGVIGPSGSGKSTLSRALVGVLPAARGAVRLDGTPISQWTSTDLGHHIGYLPQDVALFAGTIAQNIARFAPDARGADIVAAAREAGIHELVTNLPEGYETVLGEGGLGLSGGQRQRIGLARALYGAPFLVVLDEPNANLDGEGEAALTRAIRSVRERGGIVVVVAHRASALAAIDLLIAMEDGRAVAFGPKEAVLRHTGHLPKAPTPANETTPRPARASA